MEFLPIIAVLVAAGAVAGLIAGLLGVGGGIVLVPIFFNVFQALDYTPAQLMQICVATSTATIVFTSLRSVMAHHARGAVRVDLMRAWGPFIALGAVVGVLAAGSMRSQALQAVFGGIGVMIGLYMWFGNSAWRLSDTLPGRMAGRLYGAVIGGLAALMGIGGGAFSVPLLTAYGVPQHRAVGTSAGFGAVISFPALLTFLATGWSLEGKPPGTVGYVNLPMAALIIATTAATVPIGARLAHRLSPQSLRSIFALTITVLAGNMLRTAIFS